MRRVGVRTAAITALVVVGLGGWTPYGVAAPAALAEPVDLGGQDLPDGSRTDAGSPIELTAGLWADELGTGGAGTHYFTYRRAMEESTVHVGVIATSGEPSSDSVEVAASVDDTSCGSDRESPNSSTTHAAFGALVSVGSSDPGLKDSPCLQSDSVSITVTRTSTGTETDLPVAIKVVEEAPVRLESDTRLPMPDEEVRYPRPDGGPASDLEGGTSFDEAPHLDPVENGVIVTTEIPEGEERLFRVPAGWGQQVVATVDALAIEDEEIYDWPTVDLRIVEPLRSSLTTTAADESTYGKYGSAPLELSVGTSRLQYLNRFDDDVVPVLPGDFWIAVAVERTPEDREQVTVQVDLTVAVTGESGDGAPSYRENVPSTGDGPTPDGYSPDTPYLVGDGQFTAVASGNPFTSDDDSWWGARRIAGLGLGAVSLACCAVGAVWLTRRRTGPHPR